ncbi:MAG: transcription termination factor Rho [Actinomycetota bacterium]|nr:transcription termination factor Rho [Actinomycetota bacterium]MDQ6949152.1 transcription termination factor Rho [Actinomycetota bacterium]
MSEPQLERSVLEAKEREELYAIAEALGTKPGSRARKSDLIIQILRATGVVVDEPEREAGAETTAEKPRRATRARKAASTPPPAPTTEQAQLAVDLPESPASESRTEPRPPNGAGNDRPVVIDTDASSNGNASHAPRAESAPVPTPGNDTDEEPIANGSVNGRADSSDSSAPTHQARPYQTQPGSSQGPGQVQGPGQGEGPGQGQGPGAGQGQGPGQGRFDGEVGNRRNRRRRGRERTPERGPSNGDRDLQAQPSEAPYSGEPVAVKGFLDVRDEGYGFLRTRGYIAGPNDVYVSISQVRRFALRKGDEIEGACRPAGSTEKYPALLRIDTVSGLTPDEARLRPRFEDRTPLFPDQKLRLEVPGDPANLTARIVDLISPIGKGQRGLIVSPPKAGKTTVLKQIAHSIEANNPEVVLMVLLVDERPEEVTDMRRSVKGEVIASTFDRPADEHTQVAELTMERARRLVELGKDVVIVLDGITRLARAYNLAQPATGRIMSGGIDTGALYPPKKFFGSARNIEEGGSLTILATALVETGSRMDEVIFEEFKGTGNMELRLDRKLAERRIYPALDVNASSTRHEELLFDRQQLQQVWKLRRVLNALGADGGSDAAGLQLLMDKIKSTKSNDEFLAEIAKTPAPSI